MVSPSGSSAVTRPDIRNAVYREWDATGQRAAFVADQACPEVVVTDSSGNLKEIAAEQYLDEVKDAREGDASYPRSEFAFGEHTFDTVERGHEIPVDRNRAAQIGGYFNAQQEAAEILLYRLHNRHEKRVADLLFSATNFSGYTAAINGTNWTTFASADPINDVLIAKQAIRASTGFEPNKIIMPQKTLENCVQCDAVLDRIGSSGSDDPKLVTRQMLAQLFELGEVVVPNAYRNTINKGQGDPTLGEIWSSDFVLLGHWSPSKRVSSRTVARTLHWKGDSSQFNFLVEEYFEQAKRSDVIRARRQVVPEIKDASLGYLLSTVLTK